MKLVSHHYDINGGYGILSPTAAYALLKSEVGAQSSGLTQKAFTKGLTVRLRNAANGWQPKELAYTSTQPPGPGRQRAIDFFHTRCRVAIEMELGNQTVLSHDLLKLELAYKSKLIDVAVVLCATGKARTALKWNKGNFYLTLENAETFVKIFQAVLSVPLVLLGFDV